MVIDIRKEREEEVSKIVFSDIYDDYASQILIEEGSVRFEDCNGYREADIYKEDIPNIIKALQKIMELN